MTKKKSIATDERQQKRIQQIETELGPELLEKLMAAFFVLSECMVHRAVRRAKAQLAKRQ